MGLISAISKFLIKQYPRLNLLKPPHDHDPRRVRNDTHLKRPAPGWLRRVLPGLATLVLRPPPPQADRDQPPGRTAPRLLRPRRRPRGAHLCPVHPRDVGKPRYHPRHALPLPDLPPDARHRRLRPQARRSRPRRGAGGLENALLARGHRPPAYLRPPPGNRRQKPRRAGNVRHDPHLHLPRRGRDPLHPRLRT